MGDGFKLFHWFAVLSFLAVISLWGVGLLCVYAALSSANDLRPNFVSIPNPTVKQLRGTTSIEVTTPLSVDKVQPHLISREGNVSVSCDTRGNLGPCTVVVQKHPGKDWLKDRWQAASDMGGTAIPGAHWILLDFHRQVRASQVVLDWETAFAKAYRLEGMSATVASSLSSEDLATFIRSPSQTIFNIGVDSSNGAGSDKSSNSTMSSKPSYANGYWQILYDGLAADKGTEQNAYSLGRRTSNSSGQSPGVKWKMPLHIVHTIDLAESSKQIEFQYLRLFIIKPANTWGCSLWQFDVYGTYLQ